jgi:hypothetical protein
VTTSRQPDVDLEAQARSFNVFDVEIQRHSKELWSYMRDRCPVSRSEAFGGFYMSQRGNGYSSRKVYRVESR